mgnify:CR=1 FL=1
MIRKRIAVIALVLGLLMIGAPAQANDTDPTLNWWTADGGGGTWTGAGGEYVLDGTVGQPDARIWGDGNDVLVGGFWAGVAMIYDVYLPLVLRNW